MLEIPQVRAQLAGGNAKSRLDPVDHLANPVLWMLVGRRGCSKRCTYQEAVRQWCRDEREKECEEEGKRPCRREEEALWTTYVLCCPSWSKLNIVLVSLPIFDSCSRT